MSDDKNNNSKDSNQPAIPDGSTQEPASPNPNADNVIEKGLKIDIKKPASVNPVADNVLEYDEHKGKNGTELK